MISEQAKRVDKLMQIRTINAGESADNDNGELDSGLRQLERISGRLRLLGLIIILLTALNYGALAFTMLGFALHGSASLVTFLLMYAVSSSIAVFITIFTYESQRKQGDTLFEEISDELQWHIRQKHPGVQPVIPDDRPSLSARVILRAFARSTDLPFVPGKFGPTVYAVVNIFVLFLALYFVRSF
jgi:hypothetical protein